VIDDFAALLLLAVLHKRCERGVWKRMMVLHTSSTQGSALPSASIRSVGIPFQAKGAASSLSVTNVPFDSFLRLAKDKRPRMAWQTTVCAICRSAVMVRPL
jgi:hypothetical protein